MFLKEKALLTITPGTEEEANTNNAYPILKQKEKGSNPVSKGN